MKCPECNREFDDKLELKTKPTIFLCREHGLFQYVNNRLERVPYPCPRCRSNYKVPIRHVNGWAICVCEIHGEWRVSFLRSFKFRRLCSIAASKPNKSPDYYTPPELRIKRILDKLRVRYEHNKPFRNGKVIYYPDFVITSPIKLIIEASPSIWHSRWNREESDRAKYAYFKSIGYEVLQLTEKDKDIESAISKALNLY